MPTENLLIIDAIGPFFRHYKPKRINWSKIPFSHLENESGLKPKVIASAIEDFRTFCEACSSYGYNAVTLDDVAHLITDDSYDDSLRAKITQYRELFGLLIKIANEFGLKVLFTMDVMFFNEGLLRRLSRSPDKVALWLNEKLAELFQDVPAIAGIVMRFGEKDGLDVQGDFKSKLLLRNAKTTRRFLQSVLPIFEQHNRLLIFRTWSVGAYSIGDLIWNPKTFNRVFDGIDSPALVISMKYGESDFFRYLPLNSNFLQSDHKKIIEFQARREYEGFGAYPSFVGWDVEEYLTQLQSAKNVIGASVWCQTGGWGKLRQLTFIRNSSLWVEINTFAIAQLWNGKSCTQAIENFLALKQLDVSHESMVEFLRRSDVVIKKLLCVPELAKKQLFFRRLRLPPQLYVFWDRIIIDHTMKRILSFLVEDREQALADGREGLENLRQMIEIAEHNGIPSKGLNFQLATFEILAKAREYFFLPYSESVAVELFALKETYKRRFKRNYSIVLNFEPAPLKKRHVHRLLALLLRPQSKYRLIDEVVTLRALAWIYPLVKHLGKKATPKFANKQAMGIDVLFK
ncbi:hypothetical protein [Mariniblastus fucicola]|uniref:Glycosyl hydrolase family 67 n=1 Tax=Mariniblastus fucicola TaxID=980251 RepID=A0A5B9PLT2_9BACT|nr:hypothetical protein [Mariniblastus fucicola]QEG23641.1 hypothetical protein MFFC18_35420 [Mariniblastus fucicola]